MSETKNHLSAILRQVREGETYLIVDHGKPVARIEPLDKASQTDDQRRADLERRGLLRRGRGPVRREFLRKAPPHPAEESERPGPAARGAGERTLT